MTEKEKRYYLSSFSLLLEKEEKLKQAIKEHPDPELEEERIGIAIKLKLIEDAVTAVPDKLIRSVLMKKYLLNFSSRQIAKDLGYSERQIFRFVKKGLKTIAIKGDLI